MATILLVDDDPLQAILRKQALETRFDDVQRVTSAADVLCLVEDAHFAARLGLVIVGDHMPGIGGPSFVAELHTRIPGLPVLVLGGSNEDATEYAAAGDCFRAMPVKAEELLTLASRLLTEQGCKTN